MPRKTRWRPSARPGGAAPRWVEIDVKLTADGVPIVMHDDSLKRTMGVDRLVAETPRAELPPDVPTFEEAIDCFGELGLGCNVEIKPCEGREAETGARHGRDAAALLAGRICRRPCCRASRTPSLAAAFQAAPEFARALLIGEFGDDWRARAEAVGGGGHQHQRRDARRRRWAVAIKQPGYALSVYTINDRDVARALVGMGVDCVITDAPDVILAAPRQIERRI